MSGSMDKQIIQSRSRCACVRVEGWIMVWLTPNCEWSSLPLYFIPKFLLYIFFRCGYPFFSFSGSCFLACLLFLWGNHSLTHIIFRDVIKREFDITWSIYLVDGGNVNSQCRNFSSGCGRVCDLDQESMKKFSLGSQNLTKLNEITRSICIRFFIKYDIWLW